MSAADAQRLAELGELLAPRGAPWPTLGEPIRVLLRAGRLFGGAVLDGTVHEIRGPITHIDPSGRPVRGTPIHHPAATLYFVRDYQLDGVGFDGRGTSGPETRTRSTICIDNHEAILLAARA